MASNPAPTGVPADFAKAASDRLAAAQATYAKNRGRFDAMTPDLMRVAGAQTVGGPQPHISRRFSFSPADASAAAKAIRPLFVEPLLQQCATLVNRVLAEDPTYRQLIVDQSTLDLDIKEFLALDQINSDEVTAGLFKVPLWEASAGLTSDNVFRTTTTSLADWIRDSAPNQKQFAAWSAENSHKPSMTGPGGLSKISHSTLVVGKTFGQRWDLFKVPDYDASKDPDADSAWIIGGMLSYAMADYSLSYQEKQLRTSIEPVAQRNDLVASRVAYLDADVGFRTRRKVVAHDKLIAKLAAIRTPDGPLNYADRIQAIEERAAVDLKEAYGRMKAVQAGMMTVYGLQTRELPRVPANTGEQINGKLLQELVTWLREVGLTVSDIAARDQEYVHSISLRQLLGSSRFDALRDGKQPPHWEFQVSARAFYGLKYIRLRGISMEVDSQADTAYGFVARAPTKGEYIYQVGQASTELQQTVGECWVGRARAHGSPREPEVVGGRVLNNASPIGTWQLDPIPLQESTTKISDIRVNFHLAVQSA